MSAYTGMIRRLSDEQKARLLTDIQSLTEPFAAAFGLPGVKLGFLCEACGDIPSPALLARSWDAGLMRETAAVMASRLQAQGVGHVILPPLGPEAEEGLTEDPLLTGVLSYHLRAGVREGSGRGMTVSVGLDGRISTASAEAAEAEEPSACSIGRRVAAEYVAAPFACLSEAGRVHGIVMEGDTLRPVHVVWNSHPILRRRAGESETVAALLRGEILIKGSESALLEALRTHRRLQEAILRGQASTGELEESVLAGQAISDEAVDAALERMLAFAADAARGDRDDSGYMSGQTEGGVSADASARASLTRRALEGATVLLENRPVKASRGGQKACFLPQKAPARMCVLGDLTVSEKEASEAVLLRHGHTCVGFARGYDPAGARNDGLVAEAAELASRSDVTVVFMKAGTGLLPAPWLALLWEISRLGRDMVLILSAEKGPDMGFLRYLATPPAGLLLVPGDVEDACLHGLLTVLGEREPRGRLTETLTDAADPAAHRRGFAVGPFAGYRYYDTVGGGWVYPFGYGLGYTSFDYTGLTITPDGKPTGLVSGHIPATHGTVAFTVRNNGTRAGVAIPQIYVGMKDSAVLRPSKVLVAYECLYLEPGESVTVTRPWRLPLASAEGDMEQGSYRFYLGESVADIRRTAELSTGTDVVPSDGERLSDYLPSATNIHTERYVLEAEYTPMKPTLRNLICGIASLCLGVSLKIYDILTAADSLFLDIVAGLLCLGAAGFFAMDLLDRRRQQARDRENIARADAALFADAVTIPVPTAQALFAAEEDGDAENAEVQDSGEYDHFADVDLTMTLTDAVRDLAVLARERGITVEDGTVRSILSAMAASRLMVVRGMPAAAFEALIAWLGDYFLCPASVDAVDGTYLTEADMLFGTSETGEREERGVLRAARAAAAEPGRIHVAALTNVDLATLSHYFVPFARYARAPHEGCVITVREGEAESSYRMPQNLWFILNLQEDAPLYTLPDYVSEIATVHGWSLEHGGYEAEEKSRLKPFSYGQMEFFSEGLRKDFSAEEEDWKKIDALEAYAARYTPYRIGNRCWLSLELYMAALSAMGVPAVAARDEAVAVKLMPSLVASLSGKILRSERGLGETLDTLFGEEHTTLCRKLLKSSGAELV